MATRARARPLRLSAAFKLLKALLLLVLLATLLRLVHHQPTQTVLRWALALHVDPHNHYLRTFLATLLGVSPKQWALLTGGTLFYAVLFAVEGIGLWLERAWAEYLTILSTAGLLPVEFYELSKRVTVAKCVMLTVNVAILLYLLSRVQERTGR